MSLARYKDLCIDAVEPSDSARSGPPRSDWRRYVDQIPGAPFENLVFGWFRNPRR